jgi:large subunit ribosomal protein L3
MKAILGTKIGMSQVFQNNGELLPVTVIEAGPCTVVHKKTLDKDGYERVSWVLVSLRSAKLSQAQREDILRRGVQPHRHQVFEGISR